MPDNLPTNDNIPPSPMPAPQSAAPPGPVHGYGDGAQARAAEFVTAAVHYLDPADNQIKSRPPTDAERAERSAKAKASTGHDGLSLPAGPSAAEQQLRDREPMIGHDRNAGPPTRYQIDLGGVPSEGQGQLADRLNQSLGGLQLSQPVGAFLANDIVRAGVAVQAMSEVEKGQWVTEQQKQSLEFLSKYGVDYHAAVKAVDRMLSDAKVDERVGMFMRTSFVSFSKLSLLARDRGLIK